MVDIQQFGGLNNKNSSIIVNIMSMGCIESSEIPYPVATKELFDFDTLIGEGGFGHVYAAPFRLNKMM